MRHKGTIGGSIANNDPAADYPAAMLALDATIVTNKRSIQAGKFFTGLFETALKDGEIVTAVTFTAPAKAGYEKFRNPASRYAIVGVFVAKGSDGVKVAVTGAGDEGVFRSKELEAALAKKFDAACGCRGQGLGQEPDERHARFGGIPRQPDHRDGQAGGGAGQRVTLSGSSKKGAARPLFCHDRDEDQRSPRTSLRPSDLLLKDEIPVKLQQKRIGKKSVRHLHTGDADI